MIKDWQVIDYAGTDAKALAALFLDGWETAPGTHESLTDHDDLSYVVLVKRGDSENE